MYELLHIGSLVENPCKEIHSYHLHCSMERHYSQEFLKDTMDGEKKHGTVRPHEKKHIEFIDKNDMDGKEFQERQKITKCNSLIY